MRIFLGHAQKDADLASKFAERLRRRGFAVWLPEEEIAPGDNWAKKIGKALEDAELMVLLFTPKAWESEWLRRDVEFGLGSKKFEHKLFSVFVGPPAKTAKHVPWILLKLPHRQIESARDFGDVASEIRSLYADSEMSHSNA